VHFPGVEEGKSLCSVLGKKYVLLSWVCGALCVLLGVLFLVIHVLVVTRTTSLEYFQTIPAYIPAVMVRQIVKVYHIEYFLMESLKSL
jgi:hypothetical protein